MWQKFKNQIYFWIKEYFLRPIIKQISAASAAQLLHMKQPLYNKYFKDQFLFYPPTEQIYSSPIYFEEFGWWKTSLLKIAEESEHKREKKKEERTSGSKHACGCLWILAATEAITSQHNKKRIT